MVNGKDIFNVHWPNSLGLIEGFCTVCEQPWVDLNPRLFAQKATMTTAATQSSAPGTPAFGQNTVVAQPPPLDMEGGRTPGEDEESLRRMLASRMCRNQPQRIKSQSW